MDPADYSYPDDPQREPIAGYQSGIVDPPPGPSKPSKTQSPAVNRPPKRPADILGPYLQFLTTENRTYYCSALTLHDLKQEEPRLKFDHECKLDKTVLYAEVFGMTAIRWDMAFEIPEGDGDEPVRWTMTWNGQQTASRFHIPRMEQRWRGGFFSCNGFDETVAEGVVKAFGFNNVWNHMNSVHEDIPLHAMIYGGDQTYIDFIFKDIPFLKRWTSSEMDFDTMYKHEFSEEVSTQCAAYYFHTYCENWERPEVKSALQSCPAIMSHDDHDIFDGAGSYPDQCRLSPVMLGLQRTSQKFRLLFQHHTTLRHCRQHRLFGKLGQSTVMQMGPRLACLVTDARVERTDSQVIDPESWNMMFDRLDKLPTTTTHLMVIFAVPFSFIRVQAAEKIFDMLTKAAPWVRRLPGIKDQNSIFKLPELFDDLLDEWTHKNHLAERDKALVRFQDVAKKHNIRVSFLSGDVHCAGVARFRTDSVTRKHHHVKPENDHRLMYQMIASAIVNQSPSPNACIAYHYIRNKWNPVAKTSEALVEMFERRPEQGKQVRHRKVMPNRNWLMWSEVGAKSSRAGQSTEYHYHEQEDTEMTTTTTTSSSSTFPPDMLREHRRIQWAEKNYLFEKRKGFPSTLGPTSKSDGTGYSEPPLHKHGHGLFCHHKGKKSKSVAVLDPANNAQTPVDADDVGEQPVNGMRMRMWLESRVKEKEGRQFASYEIVIPGLVAHAED